jgi:nucleoside 2-deoxyribosyltransferase
MRIYLAGPEVFEKDAIALGETKKAICASYGFEGLYPLDNTVVLANTPECAYEISRLNEDLIASSDAVVANLSPFRGVSADPGTVFEVGYAAGLGKPVHGYSWDPRRYRERVIEVDRHSAGDHDGRQRHIENFGLTDNLMIEGAIKRRRGIFIAAAGDNLDLFEQVIRRLATGNS